MLALDAFGHRFSFRILGKFTSYKTIAGFFLTLLMIIALVPYALYKYNVMLNYQDSNILTIHNPDYFNETFEVSTSKHNFNLAFALVGWGESSFDGDISEYGQLKAFSKRWGVEHVQSGGT